MGRKRWKRKRVKSLEAPKTYQTNFKEYKPVTTTKMLDANVATNFRLEIDPMIYEQIMTWVDASNKEVSWFGTLKRHGNIFRVEKIALLEQEVSSTETEIEDESLGKLMFELIRDGAEGYLNWWGHSHVNMDVFWSGQDMHTIREIGRKGWVLASVFNQRREIRTAFLQPTKVMGFDHDIFVDDIPTIIKPKVDESLKKEWLAEYNAKVKTKTISHLGSYGSQRINDYYYDDPWDPLDHGQSDNVGNVSPKAQKDTAITGVELWACFWDVDNFMEACEWLGVENLDDKKYQEISFDMTFSLDKKASANEFCYALMSDLGWYEQGSKYE